jgi:uncharacterized protein YbaP (TraB family)
MRSLLSAIALALSLSSAAHAQCDGRNLITALPAPDQAALRAQADQAPFARGNYWQATKGDAVIHLIGTYHLDDPRHAAILATLAPVLKHAQTLLVEAGPDEQAALKSRLYDDPNLMVITKGPTLPEMLPPDVWQAVSDAVTARGIPAFIAAKFRPWYMALLLGMPACAMADSEPKGLDAMLMDAATAQGLTIKALEPYDTAFDIFDAMPQQDQIDMITSAVALEAKSADLAVTLADAYFAEEGRLIWEFNRFESLTLPGATPEQVDREMAVMETALITNRNRAWIPVIKAQAAKGPLLVAFGALHLSGRDGVLNLLAQDGYTITRLPLR